MFPIYNREPAHGSETSNKPSKNLKSKSTTDSGLMRDRIIYLDIFKQIPPKDSSDNDSSNSDSSSDSDFSDSVSEDSSIVDSNAWLRVLNRTMFDQRVRDLWDCLHDDPSDCSNVNSSIANSDEEEKIPEEPGVFEKRLGKENTALQELKDYVSHFDGKRSLPHALNITFVGFKPTAAMVESLSVLFLLQTRGATNFRCLRFDFDTEEVEDVDRDRLYQDFRRTVKKHIFFSGVYAFSYLLKEPKPKHDVEEGNDEQKEETAGDKSGQLHMSRSATVDQDYYCGPDLGQDADRGRRCPLRAGTI
ncbi:hypothetical protein C8R43DRAFT_1101196 [Mycena crocata]|nr:hypothetical protein C8R43DRAFT_1101196 [Mycena crocata]